MWWARIFMGCVDLVGYKCGHIIYIVHVGRHVIIHGGSHIIVHVGRVEQPRHVVMQSTTIFMMFIFIMNVGLGLRGLNQFMTVKKRHGLFQSVTILLKTSFDLICDAHSMTLSKIVTKPSQILFCDVFSAIYDEFVSSQIK